MALAAMMSIDKDAWICDLAETYHVLDYKGLPVRLLAVLSCGLRDNSRIKQKISGLKASPLEIMIAHAADNLSLLRWGMTEDGEKGRNKPYLFTEGLVEQEEKKKDLIGFNSFEEFMNYWNKGVKENVG